MNWINIGSGNGWSPVRNQAITWTNAALLSIRPFGTNQWNLDQNAKRFIQMAAILSTGDELTDWK